MDNLLEELSHLTAIGKIDKNSPYPPEMRGLEGVAELTAQALAAGYPAIDILNLGLLPGMNTVGERFSRGDAFISNMLISAQAMNAALKQLKPFFDSGELRAKGTLILGTVQGDLHDIGKNLVKMIMEGEGWEVIDLGTDVASDTFIKQVNEYPDSIVGMSALLTTTMLNMETVTAALKKNNPETRVFIGGAPVSQAFCQEVGATAYFRDPYSLAQYLRPEPQAEKLL